MHAPNLIKKWGACSTCANFPSLVKANQDGSLWTCETKQCSLNGENFEWINLQSRHWTPWVWTRIPGARQYDPVNHKAKWRVFLVKRGQGPGEIKWNNLLTKLILRKSATNAIQLSFALLIPTTVATRNVDEGPANVGNLEESHAHYFLIKW